MKFLLTLTMMFTVATPTFAQVQISDGYVRALPPGVANSSAYMTLINQGDSDVELVGASTPVAVKASLHSTMNHDGMMHMMPTSGLVIAAHGELKLESGGNHLMLEGLQETLKPGTEVDLMLRFADGSEQAITLPVRSVLDE